MNISNMKNILGEAVSNEVKTLELRVGQVVRGVVLQQYPNNEATVSINGVHVRAKLEIPLMEGQASLLQVQPDSKSGQIHLKQVDPTTMGLQDPMKDIIKALKLPDKEWAHEIIKDLRREGFALNKETAAVFQRAAQLQPAGVSQEQWMNAAAAVFKRGLPITEGTIAAMHQLQSGNPLHSLIGQLRGQLHQMLQQNSHPQLQQLLTTMTAQLEQGADLLRLLAGTSTSYGQSTWQGNPASIPSANAQVTQQSQPGLAQQTIPTAAPIHAAVANTVNTLSGLAQRNGAVQTAQSQEGLAANRLSSPGQAGQATAAGQATTAAQVQLLPQLLKWLGISHEALFAKQLMNPSSTNNQQLPAQSALTESLSMKGQNQQSQSVNSPTLANQSATQVLTQGNSIPVNPLATQQAPIGPSTGLQQQAQSLQTTPSTQTDSMTAQQTNSAVHQQLTNQAGGQVNQAQAQQMASVGTGQSNITAANASQTMLTHLQTANNTMQQQGVAVQQQPVAAHAIDGLAAPSSALPVNGLMQVESLKASLMQLLQTPDLPSAVKESAQQMLQAITGQQLMLSTERNHSVFSHITLYVPIQDDENGQTAAVHVQTRRNRKGELDSDNCRIVFDLQMQHLGPMLVDMNIVNKIVSLNLWNDHPAISPIIDTLKPEIAVALQPFGYTLSMVRASSIPHEGKESIKQEEGKINVVPPDIEQMNSTRYRGVDVKV